MIPLFISCIYMAYPEELVRDFMNILSKNKWSCNDWDSSSIVDFKHINSWPMKNLFHEALSMRTKEKRDKEKESRREKYEELKKEFW